MWGMDQGIDWMGNNDPPEELNRIVQSGDYGWPFVWGNRQVNTFIERPGVNKEEKAQRSTAPVLTYQAHSAPIAMVFYEGTLFPSDYLNDAFVAMRGSWNRSPAVGYKVVRVRFRDGQAQAFEDFLTGFLTSDGRSQVGRPAGLVVLSDGSLLVSDDSNGVIYRVRYRAGRTS
jgi:glucose/arabinose dehydrogenase